MSGTQISDMTLSATLPSGAKVPFVVTETTPGFSTSSNYIYDLGTDIQNLTRIFNSKADAELATIAEDIEFVQTGCYATEDDGGGAMYRRLASAPSDPTNTGYFQDAAGEWFGLVPAFGQDPNVKMFGCLGDGDDDQDNFQFAIDYTFAIFSNLFVPSGFYQVDQLVLPARTDPPAIDDRHKRFKLYGHGVGEGYAIFNENPPPDYEETGSTLIRGGDGKAVLVADDAYLLGGGSGVEICDLCFIGNSGSGAPAAGIPVVDLRIVQNSSFHHNILYQEGDGDGLKISMAYQCDFAFNRIFNYWWNNASGSSQTGVGIRLLTPITPSQITIRNNTMKGFHDAGLLGDSTLANKNYQVLFLYNEASTCYNGWTFYACDGSLVLGNYIEGPEGGFGFSDNSREINYIGNFIFEGVSIGFDLSDSDCRGPKLIGNTIKLGDLVGAIGVKIASANAYNFAMTVRDNFFEKTQGTASIVGIQITGSSQCIDIAGNEFNPRVAWTGASSLKISDATSDEGLIGYVQRDGTEYVLPEVANGAISLKKQALTQANVSANALTIGPGNYYSLTATGATSVNRLIRATGFDTAEITLNLKDANFTFNNGAQMKLDGGAAFTGPGVLSLVVEKVGANLFAYETGRTSLP